jgi:hypothetical protein
VDSNFCIEKAFIGLTSTRLVSALIVIGWLLYLAITALQEYKLRTAALKDLWNLGFGQVHSDTLISGWALDNISNYCLAVTASVLVANTPQALFSFLYLTLNGLLTNLFLAEEWSAYAQQRKSLRVSNQHGQQRKDYFLSLPFRVAIPLSIISALLHWLCSQSIFLAVVTHYNELGHLVNAFAVATCGFSPMAMMFTLCVGGCVVIGVVALGFRRLSSGIPLVSCCSAAIAAACHGSELDASTKPLQWGVLPGSEDVNGVGHCCLSSGEVTEPELGKKYA